MNYFGETAEGESGLAGVQVNGSDPLRLAKRGIELREAGDLDAAEKIFEELTREHPDKPYGWQEMGVLQVRRGEPNAATTAFGRAVQAAPDDVLTLSHYAAHMQSLGRLEDAHVALNAFIGASPRARAKVAAMRDFLSYLDAYPKWDILDPLNEIEQSDAFIDVKTVEARALAAIEGKEPFCVIRLGDGEGAWMDLGPEDEAAFADVYAFNRRDILELWFGTDALFDDARFQRLRGDLMKAIDACDVVGIPYSIRIALEYDKKSLRGIPSCANIIRWCQGRLGVSDTRFCSNDINIELQDAGFFRKVFAMKVPIGVISCHHDLPYQLVAETGARVDRAHLIPEEKGFSRILGANGVEGAHFPRTFERVMADLDGESQAGRVWLVSAGYLGKHYCGKIRDRGGVALDIGSLSDGWTGKITRLHLTNTERFRL